MKNVKFSLFLLFVPLLAFTSAHKFYVSVTNITYSEKDASVQIISRIFIDDMEKTLRKRYDFTAALATDNESRESDAYLEKYIRAKLEVKVNGANASYEIIGREYENDVIVLYIEVPKVDLAETESIQIDNEILIDMFEEQQNILHFDVGGKKKSFVLVRSDTKAMLNL